MGGGKARRKIGHVVQRGGSWYVPVYLGRRRVRDEATGEDRWKEQRRWVRFSSYREAREALPALCGKAAKRTLAKATNERLSDYLARWLESHGRNLAPKTRDDYERIVRRDIARDILGAVLLKDLSERDIETYLSAKAKQELGPASLVRRYALLHRALRDAVRKKLLPANPCDEVERPKYPKREMRVLDGDQLEAFLHKARALRSSYVAFYLAAIDTGLRQSELCGLLWKDVDLIGGRLTVQRAFYRLGRAMIWKAPKSQASRRTIPLTQRLLSACVELDLEQERLRRELGKRYFTHDGDVLVFAQADGKPLHAHNVVRRDFRRILDAERDGEGNPLPKLPRIRFHDLRHSFATDELRHNTHVKVVQALMGHARAAITMDIYSHVTPQMMEGAIRARDSRHPSTESSTETLSMRREAERR